MRLTDFDYRLPKELIAQYPCQNRSGSRLLVVERKGKKIIHKHFTGFIEYLSAGDCLILNNTKVISARMIGHRQKTNPKTGGGRQEIFLLENISPNVYRVLAKPANKLTKGTKIIFADANYCATVTGDEKMVKIIEFSENGKGKNPWDILGQVPLPPYIKREPQDQDKERYQTVYAQEEGATAAPTAGLHFTKALLEAIEKKGVHIGYLTLHVNYGTFSPVKSDDITKHKMHKEYFILPKTTKELIDSTRAKGGRVFAVGTTAVRVLETCAQDDSRVEEAGGWTDMFIYPPYRFKVVDCLLTNFHFPKSTLLMLVSAFGGKELIFKAYKEAIEKKYRFFSYGDAMLIV